MHTPAYSLNTLFAQMGLANSDEAIDAFISSHSPIPGDIQLPDAACWNASQAALLKQAVVDDSDWTEVVEQLDALMHKA